MLLRMRGALIATVVFVPLFGSDLEISRLVRPGEFVDAVGPRAGLFGTEDGTLEAYVYPLKIFKDLRLRFRLDGHDIPAASIARRVTAQPGGFTIVYSSDDFRVAETLAASMDEPGAVILLDVDSRVPLGIDVAFRRDFQLMWPASIGTGYVAWAQSTKAFHFGADGEKFAAVLGSPDGALISHEYATNYSSDLENVFTLGTMTGHSRRTIALAGSMESRDQALAAYARLVQSPQEVIAAADRHYRDYLANTLQLELPDAGLQSAYDWSRISVAKGMVDNPELGRGLVAGYGPSKNAYRPGFAWFFGRDSFWTSLALTAAGDFVDARTAIAFIARFQRADGKIPHEISQSASHVRWFDQFPYGYASADATPLYIIAVRDYVEASGDVGFAREQSDRLWKALAFMRSTFDENGFPVNAGVGHGWVEGGPLLPVRIELYEAGLYVEAVRSLAVIARMLNDSRAQAFEAEYETKRRVLNDRFWLAGSHAYAFALDPNGAPVDQPSVLATVPMWFDLLDRAHAREMIWKLAAEDHATDWGMRIISSHAAVYEPAGYHFGSVWPLFTGWASVGEYRNHEAQAGLANLRANAALTLDGACGNTTEVLSGDWYSPLSTASPHQIWSAAMVISPIVRGLLGLGVDAAHGTIRFAPHLPADWNSVGMRGVRIGSGKVDFELRRDDDGLRLAITNSGTAGLDLDFEPAYPACAEVMAATVDGRPVTWTREEENTDWHPRFRIALKPGRTVLELKHRGMFGYTVPFSLPRLGDASSNLKIVREVWREDGKELELSVTGIAARDYRMGLVGAQRIREVRGAAVVNGGLAIHMPDGSAGGYVRQRITIELR